MDGDSDSVNSFYLNPTTGVISTKILLVNSTIDQFRVITPEYCTWSIVAYLDSNHCIVLYCIFVYSQTWVTRRKPWLHAYVVRKHSQKNCRRPTSHIRYPSY